MAHWGICLYGCDLVSSFSLVELLYSETDIQKLNVPGI